MAQLFKPPKNLQKEWCTTHQNAVCGRTPQNKKRPDTERIVSANDDTFITDRYRRNRSGRKVQLHFRATSIACLLQAIQRLTVVY